MKRPELRRSTRCAASLVWVASLLSMLSPLAQAQYKVVMPDGSVTYTDRPPLTSHARITAMALSGSRGGAVDIGLPAELRTPVQRYPVTLYTSSDCTPCDSARRLLQQRGVPYNERRITTEDDAAALERLVGGRTLPALTIGAQPLRGLSENDWSAYLDAAGYPRENKLPRGWQPPEATALVDRSTAAARASVPTPAPTPAPAPTPTPEPRAAEPAEAPPSGTIRF